MTAEEIDRMAEEYADIYIDRFKNVARTAYQDGIMDAFAWMKERMTEL